MAKNKSKSKSKNKSKNKNKNENKKSRPARRAQSRPRASKALKARRKPSPKKPLRTRDGGPLNWPTLSTYLVVQDAAASIAFYRDAFGFRLEGEPMKDPSDTITHAGMRLGEAAIMFGPQGMAETMRPPALSGAVDNLSLYVYVPDVDALAARATAAGAQMLQAPADQFWRDRLATFKDRDGYHWTFATHLGGPMQA